MLLFHNMSIFFHAVGVCWYLEDLVLGVPMERSQPQNGPEPKGFLTWVSLSYTYMDSFGHICIFIPEVELLFNMYCICARDAMICISLYHALNSDTVSIHI